MQNTYSIISVLYLADIADIQHSFVSGNLQFAVLAEAQVAVHIYAAASEANAAAAADKTSLLITKQCFNLAICSGSGNADIPVC